MTIDNAVARIRLHLFSLFSSPFTKRLLILYQITLLTFEEFSLVRALLFVQRCSIVGMPLSILFLLLHLYLYLSLFLSFFLSLSLSSSSSSLSLLLSSLYSITLNLFSVTVSFRHLAYSICAFLLNFFFLFFLSFFLSILH